MQYLHASDIIHGGPTQQPPLAARLLLGRAPPSAVASWLTALAWTRSFSACCVHSTLNVRRASSGLCILLQATCVAAMYCWPAARVCRMDSPSKWQTLCAAALTHPPPHCASAIDGHQSRSPPVTGPPSTAVRVQCQPKLIRRVWERGAPATAAGIGAVVGLPDACADVHVRDSGGVPRQPVCCMCGSASGCRRPEALRCCKSWERFSRWRGAARNGRGVSG